MQVIHDGPSERATPMTPERAATALVGARRDVARAHDGVTLAREILTRIDPAADLAGLDEIIDGLVWAESNLRRLRP